MLSRLGFDNDELGPTLGAALALVAALIGAGCGGSVVFEGEGSGGAMAGTGGAGATNASGSSGGSCLEALPERYTMALAVELGQATPILFSADVAADGDELLLQLTPLVTPYRKGVDTEAFLPMEPFGDALMFTTSPLGLDGSFTFDGSDLRVPGVANPFGPSEIVAKLSFSGSSCGSAAPLCGTVSGEVTQPIVIELSGEANSFALTTEPGGTGLAFTIDCSGTLSNPIP